MMFIAMRNFVKGLCVALSLVTASAAFAQAGPWIVTEKTGDVAIELNGAMKPAAKGVRLNAGDEVKTGRNGRAVSTRGEQYMVVAPKTHIRIANPKTDGSMTQVFNLSGSVTFKVDKRKDKHFQVKTPYMAAVVKGTTFNVDVTDTGASVKVIEGAVEVATLDGGAVDLLAPGDVGMVEAEQPFALNIMGEGEDARRIMSPSAYDGATVSPVSPTMTMPQPIAPSPDTISPVTERPQPAAPANGGAMDNGPDPMSAQSMSGAPAMAVPAMLDMGMTSVLSSDMAMDMTMDSGMGASPVMEVAMGGTMESMMSGNGNGKGNSVKDDDELALGSGVTETDDQTAVSDDSASDTIASDDSADEGANSTDDVANSDAVEDDNSGPGNGNGNGNGTSGNGVVASNDTVVSNDDDLIVEEIAAEVVSSNNSGQGNGNSENALGHNNGDHGANIDVVIGELDTVTDDTVAGATADADTPVADVDAGSGDNAAVDGGTDVGALPEVELAIGGESGGSNVTPDDVADATVPANDESENSVVDTAGEVNVTDGGGVAETVTEIAADTETVLQPNETGGERTVDPVEISIGDGSDPIVDTEIALSGNTIETPEEAAPEEVAVDTTDNGTIAQETAEEIIVAEESSVDSVISEGGTDTANAVIDAGTGVEIGAVDDTVTDGATDVVLGGDTAGTVDVEIGLGGETGVDTGVDVDLGLGEGDVATGDVSGDVAVTDNSSGTSPSTSDTGGSSTGGSTSGWGSWGGISIPIGNGNSIDIGFGVGSAADNEIGIGLTIGGDTTSNASDDGTTDTTIGTSGS